MAGLVTTSNGTFQIKFRIAGQQFKPSLKTKSRREAETRKAEIERTLQLLDEGVLQLPQKPTREQIIKFVTTGGKTTQKPVLARSGKLKPIVDEFLALRKSTNAPTTSDTDAIHCRNLIRLIKQQELQKIDTRVLQKYANQRLSETGILGNSLSPDTVQKELATFNSVWSFAVHHNYIDDLPSPTKGVQLPKVDEKPPFRTWNKCESFISTAKLDDAEAKKVWDSLFLDTEQVLELVEHARENARHQFIYVAIAIAAFTGARRSEIIRSQVDDWDFENNVFKIRSKKASRKMNITFRDLPIHPNLKNIIQVWFENHHPGGLYTIMVPPGMPRARKQLDHPTQLTPDQARTHFESTFSGSKWEVLRGWHVLRHSFCSNCARKGYPDSIIDAWMGHQGDEAVKKRYRHLFPQDANKYMRKLFS